MHTKCWLESLKEETIQKTGHRRENNTGIDPKEMGVRGCGPDSCGSR
jgi:hypothetical protein